jgi:hypothetical protein
MRTWSLGCLFWVNRYLSLPLWPDTKSAMTRNLT